MTEKLPEMDLQNNKSKISQIDLNQIVDVYFNLHKKIWSLRGRRSGKVIGHTYRIILHNCKFVVNYAGRERVLREKRKNVHAYVRGNISQTNTIDVRCMNPVTYNPYKYSTFINLNTNEPIFDSALVLMNVKDGVPEVFAT